MKFYKLVKSIDYVTYPSLIELRKISASIGDAISSFQNIILAALISTILELSTISTCLVKKIASWPLGLAKQFSTLDNAGKILSVCIGFLIYFILSLIRWGRVRWGSNKNTIDERNQIASDFYKDELPHLIAIKSIIDQHDSKDSDGNDKDPETKYLLLLQANYELTTLIHSLNNANIIERNKKTKELTKDSSSLLDHIGEEAYTTMILDTLDCAKSIFEKASAHESQRDLTKTLQSLRATISSSKAINQCTYYSSVQDKYDELEPYL